MSIAPASVLSRVVPFPASAEQGDLAAILEAGLGGAVRARLPENHPLRPALRAQALALAMRHAQMVQELRPLLRAWAAAGIPAMLLKGFALAEFEYQSPGERFHGDIDVLLPDDPHMFFRAAEIALAYGWRSDGQHADPDLWTHEAAHLYGPGGHIRLDVHRLVVASSAGASPSRQAQLTQALWQRAQQRDWQGIAVYLPHPTDAAVIALILGRSWGGDSGGLKPADYLDLELLLSKYGLGLPDLERRAEELGAGHTLRTFLEFCNPERRVLNLDYGQTAPAFAAALRRDGLHPRMARWRLRLQNLRLVWPQLGPALGDVLSAWWALRQSGDPRQHLARWTPRGLTYRAPLRDQHAVLGAVSLWTRLLYPRQRRLGICVPRAYASYRGLRRLGHPVQFLSGVAKVGGQVTGHAWIEDDRGTIDGYGEPLNRQRFKVMLIYPEGPEQPE